MTEPKPTWKVARNKYNARKVTIDGYTFDSQAEATRYGELCMLEREGEITDLRVHPKFTLQEAFTDRWDNRVRAIRYTADFAYVEKWGEQVVEDVKGGKATQTAAFRIKAKLFRKRYPDVRFEVVER